METRAYFLIKVKEGLPPDSCQQLVREIETIPEVKSVEVVDGICNLLAQIEAQTRVILVAHKIMAKEWVKEVQILKVKPPELDKYESFAAKLARARSVNAASLIGVTNLNVQPTHTNYALDKANSN